ncbi:MAG TPA: GAP family protein [Gaiellaceae bacterium]|nr:GAP family protein [Gaiellaceae bacterium]
MNWVYSELALTSLAAMLSPTTLSFSVLALVLGQRPLRTGVLFYLGAFTATIAIGILAAFVLGDKAASHTSTPKTWVAIVDVVAAVIILAWVARWIGKPLDPKREQSMVDQMSTVASSPAIAIVGAGAALANPGGFIPLALKEISETNPTTTQYCVLWLCFTLISLLPLGVFLIMLVVAREWTERLLGRVRDFLLKHAMQVAGVIMILLAATLLRNGIAGLTS